MRGTYFLGNGAFETRDMPEHPLAPREVLIQVAACGVCGTDVHIYHGDKGSAEVIPPVVLGHELSGTVAAVGGQTAACRRPCRRRPKLLLRRVPLLPPRQKAALHEPPRHRRE